MSTIKGFWVEYDNEVSYKITDDMKDRIMVELLKYYREYGYLGEIICQSDEAIIEAPYTLSNICDHIIKFKSSYTEDETD